MHASRTRVMLPFLSTCAMALLLLSPASADPADSPADAPTAVSTATMELADDEVAGRTTTTPRRHHPSALSPEQRRGLEHEARCAPRVSVRRGAFPLPGRCRGSGGDASPPTHGGSAADAPAAVHHRLQPLYDEP
ncbi:hypothetical protein HU200_049719 [Digitaria exilis]|uniref:Secreted protein n=1 Tax=Digitaria exilis TaxID=1010633 RepID=A0A835E872_9POAL|nr:hypothetical protein HU200_049719 [Digitaria exilis]